MTFKKVINYIHLYLGLFSGVIIFIIAITGCLYAFKQEIESLTQPYRFVKPQSEEFFPPSRLKSIAEEQLPGKHIHAVLYGDTGRAAQVIFFNFEPDYHYYFVFINPYTGEVLKVKNMESDFFQFILNGHFYLWLPPAIGQPVAATATLIFVVMLTTGIILWWPRNKGSSRQRFTIKWTARWRRKNYDLHNVLGFYAFAIAVVLALTGLVWGFQWFGNAVHKAVGGEKSLLYADAVSDKTTSMLYNKEPIDQVWDLMRKEYPGAKFIEVHVPETDSSSIAANTNPDDGTYWKMDYRYFNQYTLEELSVDHIYGRFDAAASADKLLRMNYDIHTGAILGFPGKLLAFFASLIVASLPVTGFCIWWGRRNKAKDPKNKKTLSMQPAELV